jgi:hypothetical protein
VRTGGFVGASCDDACLALGLPSNQ